MKLGIIGGSGLEKIAHFNIQKSEYVTTPFGQIDSPLCQGTMDGHELVFLSRHGEGHTLLPGELNHRANIYAMKMLGVTHILSLSAVGSLREDFKPRDVVIVDQYFDRTRHTDSHTFFGDGCVAHISFAHPVCPELSRLAEQASRKAVEHLETAEKPAVHFGGTYVNMEGPAFSTLAESNVYRSWGLDVIGMTNLGEAKLAREAEICYATVAMVTDYDCWKENDHVSVEKIIGHMNANVALAKEIIRLVAASFDGLKRECACPTALAGAVITAKDRIPPATYHKLELLLKNRI